MALTFTKMADTPTQIQRPAFVGPIDNKLTIVGGRNGSSIAKVWQSTDGTSWSEVASPGLNHARAFGSGFYKWNTIFIEGGSSGPGSFNKYKNVDKGIPIKSGGFRFRKGGSLDLSNVPYDIFPIHSMFVPIELRKGFVYTTDPASNKGVAYWKEDITKGGKAYTRIPTQINYSRGPYWMNRQIDTLTVFTKITGNTDPRQKIMRTTDGVNFVEVASYYVPNGATEWYDAATVVYNGSYWLIGGIWSGGSCCGINRSFTRTDTFTQNDYTSFDMPTGMREHRQINMKAANWLGSMWLVGVYDGSDYKAVWKATWS